MELRTYLETFAEGDERDAAMAALAKAVCRTTSAVRAWFYGTRKVPGTLVTAVADATEGKVRPHELRPDIYPAPGKKGRRRGGAARAAAG